MSKFAFIPGIILTAVLICLLALSRIAPTEPIDLDVFTTDVVELPKPPPAPELSEPDAAQPVTLPPPPTPDLNLTEIDPEIDLPEVVLSPLTVSIETPIDVFRQTSAVADLPPPPKPKPVIKPRPTQKTYPKPTKSYPKPTPKKTYPKPAQKAPPKPAPKKYTPPPPKPAPKKPTKSQYSFGELDSAPRVTRTGRFSWPRSGKGTEGKVVMKLKITKSGKVEVLAILSSTNPSLNDSAKKVARDTRFTPPLKHGQKVEAIYTKTFLLKKP